MNERRGLLSTARALQCPSYLDEHLLVIWHRGANEVAIRGPLGEWRGLRVPEGRGGPRFREPFPSRPVRARNGRNQGRERIHYATRRSQRHAPVPAPSTIGVFDPEVSNA
jgi:hypothetical protein